MKEEEREYGIEITHNLDEWNRCTAKIPEGVDVDDSDAMFVKVLDEDGKCIYAAKKIDVVFWRQYPLEEESDNEDEETEDEEEYVEDEI